MAEMKASTPGDSSSGRRRSPRVNISMPVIVRGAKGKEPFEEAAATISVNAHGCMVKIGTIVTRSQQVSIINKRTTEELPCTVVFIGKSDGGKTEVGVEFTEPSPAFWRINFPPEDWDPSERKRSGGPPPPPATSPR
jgi:hypothetical protein